MMYRRMCVEKELKAPGQGQQGSEERRIDGNDVNKFISFLRSCTSVDGEMDRAATELIYLTWM